ncbi:MAG: methionine biosynthesis protein MetW [Gammaproteobacteria bacterium]|nr:MAG: methionine biosynthesis protein MetW [Gammaproteobacteria bacterium]
MTNRTDLDIIKQWIKPSSHILDLGCGDGTLLKILRQEKSVEGYGLEIDPDKITACVANGVNVLETDLDEGLSQFSDKSFDTVVMTQALQVMRFPHLVLDEMLRVGKECVVTFPNFGNWRARFYLLTRGRMPVTKQLSYQWYDTPNIHFCTVDDFEALCAEKDIRLLHREFVANRLPDRQIKGIWPNLFSDTAIYHLSK